MKLVHASVCLAMGTLAASAQGPIVNVRLQSATPGIAQNGHVNISGTALFGSVGIGTSNPARKLSLFDSNPYLAHFESPSSQKTAVEIRNGSNSTLWEAGVTGSAGTFDVMPGSFYFYRAGYTHLGMFITPDGNIGVPGNMAIGSLSFTESALTVHDNTSIGTAGHFHTLSGGDSTGLLGVSDGTSGACAMVAFQSCPTGVNYGIWARAVSPAGYSVFAQGNLGASGTKQFRIDHPQDPENKYLIHYSAEGPEPLLIYSGETRLDSAGKATVALPSYFNEIAKDARIQLTPAGASMPNLYASESITNNRFGIFSGKPNGKVYWEVKAIRNDAYVRMYGAPVEVQKTGKERGKYLHPELYGRGEEDAIMNERVRCDSR